MPPNSIAVLDIELRNTGNSVDDIRAELFSNNDGVEQIGSLISIDGWGVILLDDSLAAGVDPWSTGRIRMQISTPSDSTGSLDFGIRAGPAGLPHQDFSFTSIVISTRISGSFLSTAGIVRTSSPVKIAFWTCLFPMMAWVRLFTVSNIMEFLNGLKLNCHLR